MTLTSHEEQPGDRAPPPPAVLVVDDVEANLVALEASLKDMGCEVVVANSGDQALRQLLRQDFAVMLLDVQMPGMDGYEVAHHARSNPATRDVPIIFLTAAHNDEGKALRAYGSGAVDYLLKPISGTVLRSKVRVFLELHSKRGLLEVAKQRLEDTNQDLEKAYRELQQTQAQLVQSAKMASLGQLVAGVAHELNNPLAFSMSHLQTALRCLDEVDEEQSALLSSRGAECWKKAINRLTEMRLGLDRIADLVEKLRTFSRLDDGGLEQLSVREAIDALLTILKHRVGPQTIIETRLSEPDRIACSPSLMNQGVMNLVVNALDAISGEGTITITAGAVGKDFLISVADTGSGIPAELVDRVFEPFFTTKGVGEGTGLGLALAYSVVKKHGGELYFENQSRGARACIRIPAARLEC